MPSGEENGLLPEAPASKKSFCQHFANLLSCFPNPTKQQVLVVFFAALAVSGLVVFSLFKAGVFAHRDCDAQAHCGGHPATAP